MITTIKNCMIKMNNITKNESLYHLYNVDTINLYTALVKW